MTEIKFKCLRCSATEFRKDKEEYYHCIHCGLIMKKKFNILMSKKDG